MTLFVTRLAELPVGARSFLYASDMASDGLKTIKKGSNNGIKKSYAQKIL